MAGLPDITVTGTLTADPELRYSNSGTAVANFTVAANDRRYNRDTGQWEDAGTTFLRCSLWRDAAEHVTESLSKGMRVLLTGSLRQREWETPEGEKRYAFEVDVTEIGPSLKWATAKVAKAARTSTNGAATSGGDGGDPWTATAKTGGDADKPPF